MTVTYNMIFPDEKYSAEFPENKLQTASPGDRGENIIFLHRCLNLVSMNFSAVPPVFPVDDIYSVSTSAAVSAFQNAFGLTVNGTVNHETAEHIENICRLSFKVRKHCDETLKIINKKYIEIKTPEEYFPVLNLISIFNPDTGISESDEYSEENFEKFKKYYNIHDSEEIYKKMISISKAVFSWIPDRFRGYLKRDFPGNILKKGMAGTDVEIFQACLRYRSFSEKKIYFRNITGIYDDDTEKAVKSYQREYGLEENGHTGFFIWNLIVNS